MRKDLWELLKDYKQQHAGSRLPASLWSSIIVIFCVVINVPNHCRSIITLLIEGVCFVVWDPLFWQKTKTLSCNCFFLFHFVVHCAGRKYLIFTLFSFASSSLFYYKYETFSAAGSLRTEMTFPEMEFRGDSVTCSITVQVGLLCFYIPYFNEGLCSATLTVSCKTSDSTK